MKIFCCTVGKSCLTLCDPMNCNTPGFPVLTMSPEFAQTHVHWVGDTIRPSNPLSSPSPPSFNLSQHQGLFQWVSPLWTFVALCGQRIGASTFSISPSSEYSASISFGIYWFDLLAVQGTLKSLKYHSLKALILQHSVFFRVHLSHLYMTTGKIIPLTIQILVNEVMSLLFNMLSMFVIALFPRKKRLLKYVGMRIILF